MRNIVAPPLCPTEQSLQMLGGLALADIQGSRADRWRDVIKADTFGRYHLEMGFAILHRGEDEAVALQHLQNAVSWRPTLAEAQYLLVDMLQRRGDAAATRAADAASAASPRYRILGPCLLALRALRNGNAASVDEALGVARANDPDSLELQALDRLLQLKRGEAAEPFGGDTRFQVESSEVWVALAEEFVVIGRESRTDGRMQLAESAFRSAIACDADSIEAHAGLAAILKRRSDMVGAQRHFERCHSLAPYDSGFAFELAEALRSIDGRMEEAAAAYRTVLSLDPTNLAARRALRRALLASGQASQAIAEVRTLLGQDPADTALLKELGLYLLIGGSADAVLELYATLPGPKDGNVLVVETLAHVALGRTREPRALIDGILADAPGDSRATAMLALLELLAGNWGDARRLAEQALETARKPDANGLTLALGQALVSAGIVAERCGNAAQADALFGEAAKRNPDQVWSVCRLHLAFWPLLQAAFERIGFTRTSFWPATVR